MALYTNDSSCTSPLIPEDAASGAKRVPLRTNAFFGNGLYDAPDDGQEFGDFDGAVTRLKQGHFEFVVAGECDMTNDDAAQCNGVANPLNNEGAGIGYLTKHVDGIPRDCAKADSYFVATDPAWDGITVPGSGYPLARASTEHDPDEQNLGYTSVTEGAPIKVNVAYLKADEGAGVATQALHLDNVIGTEGEALLPVDENNSTLNGVEFRNLVTAQQYPWNMEPTMATAPSGELWDATGLIPMEQRFSWTATLQEWSVKAANGVQTSIMVNFPTKGYHVDQYCNEIYAGNNSWRWNGVDALACATAADTSNNNNITAGEDYSPLFGTGRIDGQRSASYPPAVEPFTDRWELDPVCTGVTPASLACSPIGLGIRVWDRDEYSVNITDFSPSRGGTWFPWEVGLLSFDTNGGALGGVAGEVYIDAVNILGGAENGWINVDFISAANSVYNKYYDALGYGLGYYSGLPMHGMMIKTRDQGVPATTYGQGTENGYRWEYVPQE
ncbi:hypothetical protein [Thiohalocapsa marina]|uniref:hypothetical protein n=1 Tax=Thiohalocapsa marina TaxID=424902 RepID=UPI0036DE63F5